MPLPMRDSTRSTTSLRSVRAVALRSTTLSLVFAGLLVSGCKKSDEATPAEAVPVQAAKVEVKPMTEYISAETTLTPRQQAAIVPKISAPVEKFYVQRGDHVHQGQLLAVLENRDLAGAVQDTRGAMTQADATFLTTTKATVPEDMQKAQLDVAQAKATMDLQQTIVNARQKLLDEGAIPRRDLETAQAALVQAKSAYDIAVQHLESLKSVSQAATVQNAQGALESAKGKYKVAAADLSYSEIRSPIDGVVTDRPLYAGEMANAGQAVVTVMQLSTLLAKVHVTPAQAAAIKLGAPAKVTVPGVAEPVPGKVSLISPALDPGSTTLEIWVEIQNRKGAYKAGTPVQVSMAGRSVPDALVVPTEAIVKNEAGQPALMVIGPDSVAHQKTVTTGISDQDETQIVSGVAAGDTVVTTGAYGMDDGTKVTIKAAGAADDDDKGAAADDKGGAADATKPAAGEPAAKSTAGAPEEK